MEIGTMVNGFYKVVEMMDNLDHKHDNNNHSLIKLPKFMHMSLTYDARMEQWIEYTYNCCLVSSVQFVILKSLNYDM